MSKTWRYWLCQVTGWGGWLLLQVFIAYMYAPPEAYLSPELKRNLFFFALFSDFFWFILVTHLLRLALKKSDWLRFSPEKILVIFIAGVLLTGTISFYGSRLTTALPGKTFESLEIDERRDKAVEMEKELNVSGSDYYLFSSPASTDTAKHTAFDKIKMSTGWSRDKQGAWHFDEPRKGRLFWGVVFNFILTSLWLLIYFVWHYAARDRKDKLDKLRLEGLVKTLELKTIKSHINPHFIFNALNSIRALVDENPQRARTAITELSNILRSSLKAETQETVPLQQELDIVGDYLALEHMRFEERLKIEMNIDPDTVMRPVPPMMLQTLVENAIKHGISKSMNGGIVRISSKPLDDGIILRVENTGHLPGAVDEVPAGFGWKSTRDRLNLLYNGRARFDIHDRGDMVEATITLPTSRIS